MIGHADTASGGSTPNCPYCGMVHSTKCPMVKAYEYNSDGTIKRIEFFSPGEFAPPVVYGPNGTHPWWPAYTPIVT